MRCAAGGDGRVQQDRGNTQRQGDKPPRLPNAASSGGRRVAGQSFPPAEEVSKGSRVEVAVASEESGQPGRFVEAEVVQIGSKDKQDLVRVQYSSDRNEEGERGIKEWIALSSLRPVPPEPPEGWLLRLQMYDIIQARQGSCWADTIYYETKLPVTEESEAENLPLSAPVLVIAAAKPYHTCRAPPLYTVRAPTEIESVELPASRLRQLWSLNSETRQWRAVTRRAGPSGGVLLGLSLNGQQWSIVCQDRPHACCLVHTSLIVAELLPCLRDGQCAVAASGPLPPVSSGLLRKPTSLEKEAAAISQQAGVCSVLLKQENGTWSFGGDGRMGEFVTPIAPLPPESAACSPMRFRKGAEVGPTDDGYLGSWFAATVVDAREKEVCLQYHTLEESDGKPLVEWQPCSCLRPPPPPIAPGCFPPDRFSAGDFVQLWYNDGWWEATIVDEPELSGKQGDLRPFWVWRGGEWFWRAPGGGCRTLTYRTSDGKAAREGFCRPTSAVVVHDSIVIALKLEKGRWSIAKDGGAEGSTNECGDVEWTGHVTLLRHEQRWVAHSAQLRPVLSQLELEEPTPQGCFSPGQYVEVRQEEVDFEGSYYSADLLSIEVKKHISSLSRLKQLPCIPPTPEPKCCRLNLTADQLSFASLQEEVAVVRYHAFEEEDNPNVKLTDKVAVRQIRPRPPATPVDFVSSVRRAASLAGALLEFSFEDGWWLARVLALGDETHMPPSSDPDAHSIGTAEFGLDGKQYGVVSVYKGKIARKCWESRDEPGWTPPAAGAAGAMVVVESHPYKQQHRVAPRQLRPCVIWRWRAARSGLPEANGTDNTSIGDNTNERIPPPSHPPLNKRAREQICGMWDTVQSITALEIFEGMQAEEERQRASNFFKVQRRRKLAEAKRLHKQEEAETKRQQKDSLKDEKRRAKEAEEARKLAKEQKEEERKRVREEQESDWTCRGEELGEKKKKSSRSSLSNKHVAAAAKKGWTSGKAVEAPLLGGGDDGEFMGSWYGGTIDGFRAGAVLVVFEAVDNLPFMRAAQGEAVTEGEEDSTLEAWVNYEMLRPRAPPTPNGFDEAMEEGCALEVRLQGGWWEVELVRKAEASCERLTVRRRDRGERAQGGQHPVQGEMEQVFSREQMKCKRSEKDEAIFEQLQADWPTSSRVEVMQTDPGMLGSWFEAEVSSWK
ncbi:MAG: hypothetical protein SGPRY_001053 [Prymnesium sp.]